MQIGALCQDDGTRRWGVAYGLHDLTRVLALSENKMRQQKRMLSARKLVPTSGVMCRCVVVTRQPTQGKALATDPQAEPRSNEADTLVGEVHVENKRTRQFSTESPSSSVRRCRSMQCGPQKHAIRSFSYPGDGKCPAHGFTADMDPHIGTHTSLPHRRT